MITNQHVAICVVDVYFTNGRHAKYESIWRYVQSPNQMRLFSTDGLTERIIMLDKVDNITITTVP